MRLSSIDTKLALVRNALTAKEIAALTAMHANEYLALDLIYAIVRHRNWLHVSVFKHLLGAHLVRRHGIEFEDCQHLLAMSIAEFSKFKRLTHPVGTEASDREFIRYVFILTLSTTDEQKLILELGLGVLFLQKLKEFLRQVAQGHEGQSFLFGFEAMCYETLASLASELMGDNAKLATYRLQYQLAQGTDNDTHEVIAKFDPQTVLDLLQRMHANPLTERDIDSTSLPASVSAAQFVERLAHSGLIYHGDFLARKRLYVWRVTSLGADIAMLAQSQHSCGLANP
ncbi:MAG: hypothetical protein OYH77_01380 [Pseudomonadota bacterium]|nr:hypothetical protein [Pseudomonadota bacterium]